jgi:hypothetical protein
LEIVGFVGVVMPNFYLLAGLAIVVISFLGIVVSRARKRPSIDQLPPNVLDRIRTEYR